MSDIITLAQLKTHLRYPGGDTADDTSLMNFIEAADEVIMRECGNVTNTQYDEYYDGGDLCLYLRHIPILAVNNVEEGWGWIDYELDYVQVNEVPAASMFAYSLDIPETGKISRRSAGNVNIPFIPGQSNIHVNYQAGRPSIPAAIILAALELCAHWWQNSQQRGGGGAQNEYSYDSTNVDFTRTTGLSAINQGVPYRILEMLKPHRRFPIIG